AGAVAAGSGDPRSGGRGRNSARPPEQDTEARDGAATGERGRWRAPLRPAQNPSTAGHGRGTLDISTFTDPRSALIVPIAFHPEPASDADVDGTTPGGAGAAEHSNSADRATSPAPAPDRDPLTQRILDRGDASLSAATYDSETDGEQFDLADRQALRRVGGLSTELDDVTEVEYRQLRLERVVLARLYTSGNAEAAQTSLRELAALAETAGSEVLDGVLQRRAHPDPATFLGKGKAAELADLVAASGADTVVADGELAPGQRRALEDVVKVKVIDRTA